jgi:hypothetical protein
LATELTVLIVVDPLSSVRVDELELVACCDVLETETLLLELIDSAANAELLDDCTTLDDLALVMVFFENALPVALLLKLVFPVRF